MTSLLNTTTTVKTLTTLDPHIKRSDVLALLHNRMVMLGLNPLLKSYQQLPPPKAQAFYDRVPQTLKPSSAAEIKALPVFAVIESSSSNPNPAPTGSDGTEAAEGAETWRGGWAKRFIPDEITYETSVQFKEDGIIGITHAPMGVNSVTTWVVREEEGSNGLVLENVGECTSNRMLMAFIRTTLQDSYDKLTKDFVEALKKFVDGKGGENELEKIAISKEVTTASAGA